MNRPTGVTVLAILAFVFAGFCVLGGIVFLVGGAAVGTMGAARGCAVPDGGHRRWPHRRRVAQVRGIFGDRACLSMRARGCDRRRQE